MCKYCTVPMKCAADKAVILKRGLSVEGADPGKGQGV
jgi:hypothetical protein